MTVDEYVNRYLGLASVPPGSSSQMFDKISMEYDNTITKDILMSNNKKIIADIRRYNYKYRDHVFKLSKEDVLKFIKLHNASVPISMYTQKYQFTKDEIKNILMQDTMMRRNSNILGGQIPCKIYMARAIIREQLCVDNELLDYIIDFYNDDEETQRDLVRYIIKFYGTKKIKSKLINITKLCDDHADIVLYLELQK